MNVVSLQLTTLLCLFAGNVLFGGLPLLFTKIVGRYSNSDQDWSRKIKLATFLLYLGGGVFISNCFLILLPQAHEEFENRKVHNHADESGQTSSGNSLQAQIGHHHDNFPIPELLVLCSFFFAYILQELIYCILLKLNDNYREIRNARASFCSCAKRHTECSRTYKDARPDQTLFGQKLMESVEASPSACAIASIPPEVTVTANTELLRSSILSQAVPNYGTVTTIGEPPAENPLPVLPTPVILAEERGRAVEQLTALKDRNKFLVSGILSVVALALQYIFIGMNLGLRAVSTNKWLYLVVACVQNFLLTFSAGSDLAAGNMELSCLTMHVVLLSTISPIGLLVAMTQRNFVETISHTAKGTVAAIACGTLLYTTFYEMLRQNRLGSITGLTKFCAIIMGFGIMAALQYAFLAL